jgi:hypothetical protein
VTACQIEFICNIRRLGTTPKTATIGAAATSRRCRAHYGEYRVEWGLIHDTHPSTVRPHLLSLAASAEKSGNFPYGDGESEERLSWCV